MTDTELTHVGVGAILEQLPTTIDDHQTHRALHFVSSGAGHLLPQRDLAHAKLTAELQRQLTDFPGLVAMAEAARAQAMHAAAERLADACLEAAEARA